MAIAMHPELRAEGVDAGAGYPTVIRELAPIGLRGLLLVTFAAAFMSTVSTQMNWGASYLVNDLYKRFLAPDATDRQLIAASRLASVVVLMLGGGVAWFMLEKGVSVDQAWAFLAALGAGVGAVFILRWFWWRINVWSEIVAMAGSLLLFMAFELLTAAGDSAPESMRWLLDLEGEYRALVVASGTLLLWVVATLLTRPTDATHLAAFYRKVRPDGPGWRPVARLVPDVRPDGTLARSLLCVLLGTAAVWLMLPGIGAVIFGEWGKALLCLLGAGSSVAALLFMLPKLQPRT